MPLVYDITVQLPLVEADVDVGAGPVPLEPPEEPPDPLEEPPEEVDVPDEPVPDDPLVPLLLVPELVPPPSSPPPLLVPLDEPVPSMGPLDVPPEAPPELCPPLDPPFEPPFDEPPPNDETGVELLLHATAPTARPSKLGTKTSKPLGSLDPRDESFDMTFPLSMAASAALTHQVSRERPPGNATAVSCWLKVSIPWHDMVTGRARRST